MENYIKLDENNVIFQKNMPFYDISTIDYHWHDAFELIIVETGTLYVEVNGQPLILNQNEGCFINIQAMHYYKSLTQECIISSIIIHPNYLLNNQIKDQYLSLFLNHGLSYYLIQKDDVFIHALESAFNQTIGYELLINNYIISLLLDFLHHIDLSHKNKDAHRIKETITWMKVHIDEPLSIDEIAKNQNISARECQRMFMHWLGRSPMEYLRRLRILCTTELLKDTDLPIGDIAATLHFATASHYSKVFKDVIGCTPMQLRKMQKAKHA